MKHSTIALAAVIAAAAASGQGQTITSDTGHHPGDGYPRAVAKISPAAIGCGPGGLSLVVGDERLAQPRIVSLVGAGDVQTYPVQGAPMAGIAVAADGTFYAADPYLHVVWRLPAGGGVATRVAGSASGVGGFAGDGGPATAALLNAPTGLALDSAGQLYVADTSNMRVRRVAADGTISTYAGGNTACADGRCDGGPATSARLSQPGGVEVDRTTGDLYITERLGHRVRVVRRVTGTIATVAGTGAVGLSGDGGPATAATLTQPADVAVGPDGSLYLADAKNHAVRRVRPDGVIERVAGTGYAGAGPDGPATTSRLDSPRTVEWCNNRLYVGEQGANQRIRVIDVGAPAPTVTSPIATATQAPTAVATTTPTRTATSTNTSTPSSTPTRTHTATPTCGCCAQCG